MIYKSGRRATSRSASGPPIRDLLNSSINMVPDASNTFVITLPHNNGHFYNILLIPGSNQLDMRHYWEASSGINIGDYEAFREWWMESQFHHGSSLFNISSDFFNPSFGELFVALLLFAKRQGHEHFIEIARMMIKQWTVFVELNVKSLLLNVDNASLQYSIFDAEHKHRAYCSIIDDGKSVYSIFGQQACTRFVKDRFVSIFQN
jgi:hypothetical protein